MVKPDETPISGDSYYLRALTQDDWWEQMEDRVRVTSAPFYSWRNGEPGEISCYSDTKAGREVFARRFPNTPAARFSARDARGKGFNICRDPDGDIENSPEHFVLTHQRDQKKQYHRDCKQLGLDSIFIPSESLTQEPPSCNAEG